MSWNEPPEKNPWDKKGKHGSNGGPPDIGDVIASIQKGVNGLFGNSGNRNFGNFPYAVVFIVVFLLALWLAFDSFYAVNEQERGVVLRFGRHVAELQPGLSLRFPRPIEEVIKVNVGQVRAITHKASMLTQDENIVDVEVVVKWRIHNPTDYLFNLYAPDATLRQVTESAVREIIGKNKLDFVFTGGRFEISQQQQVLIQEVMDLYKSGILIANVEMQYAKAPEEVKSAFDDAITAREDEQRSVNQAEAYKNDIIPKARGAAARLREEASSYKAKIITKADGEANRFEQLLAEYQRAPEVTRQRLYLDTMEAVLSSSGKILVDSDSSNNLIYLPIDKLLSKDKPATATSSLRSGSGTEQNSPQKNMHERAQNRNRGVR